MNRVALALALALAASLWLHFKPEPAPTGVQIQAAPAKPVAKVEKDPVDCGAPLIVYKPAAKAKLKLPEPVAADPAQRVAASTTTANDERIHTVTTLVNTETGDFATFDRVEPDPWVAVNTKSELGVSVGYLNAQPAVRVDGRQELLQVKGLHLGLVGSAAAAPTRLDTFIGVGAWGRW